MWVVVTGAMVVMLSEVAKHCGVIENGASDVVGEREADLGCQKDSQAYVRIEELVVVDDLVGTSERGSERVRE